MGIKLIKIIVLIILLENIVTTKSEMCEVSWDILTKPITLGEEVQLQCNIKDKDLCPGIPRWEGGPDHQIISVNYTVFENSTYGIIFSSADKYILAIKNITKELLNSRFVCHVRFNKHGDILKNKHPIYSLKGNKQIELMETASLFANVSAVPTENKTSWHYWSRRQVGKDSETLLNSDKFLQTEEVDGLNLTIKNVTLDDVNMIYQLNYSNTIFITHVKLGSTERVDTNEDSNTKMKIWMVVVAAVAVIIVAVMTTILLRKREMTTLTVCIYAKVIRCGR